MRVILLVFFLHIIFLLSVFDIYFKSPIVNNVPVQKSKIVPPAKRLVLFVADGLRADSIFSVVNNEVLSPFLRDIIQSRGVWGVAHSRVPTESRPGHIALIAGFYEDPSAVFSGWKDNVVEFDSVFNRSHVTYSWGSPDILPMFKKGATENKIHTFCYNADDEDFSGNGSTLLNTWVFDKVTEFIHSAELDVSLKDSLNSQSVVLFLHLLGPDVAGHASKPHSREYRENINVVDEGVKKIESLLNEFYGYDNKTAFIYTSDHGMTDWGSHGAGSLSETEVPLIVWGAGSNQPQVLDTPDPNTPVQWGLQHLRRLDVAQADICPLMATLIGIPIPVHSVGILPLDYLSLTDEEMAKALAQNAFQLAAQFGRKRDIIETDMISWLYRPFPELNRDKELSTKQNIATLISEQKYNQAIEESKVLIKLSQSGLDYYHSYFQGLLLCCVSFTFVGWIVWLFFQLLSSTAGNMNSNYSNRHCVGINIHVWPDTVFFCFLTGAVFLIYVQSLPVQFYLYCCLPFLVWWAVIRQLRVIHIFNRHRPFDVIGSAILYLILLELLVATFFQRWILSLVVSLIGFWPFSLKEKRKQIPNILQMCWVGSLLVLAIFPALPVVGQQMQIELVVVCGVLWVLFGLASLYCLGFSKSSRVIVLQPLMLALATVVILTTSQDFDKGLGLLLPNQVTAWVLLGVSVTIPIATGSEVPVRLLSIGLGLAVPFLLLCVGHEAFFLLVLFFSLCVWLATEAKLTGVNIKTLRFQEEQEVCCSVSSDDFRRCFFFLMYIILSFFGTGNIASINSFDISWVRCFLTVFSPFTMMALILLKTIVPFLLVTCIFRAINNFSQVKAENMFVIVLIYCDLMGLHFLFAVTNQGSWLEIGTSVSHFVIMEVTVLFLASLYYIARLYTDTVFIRQLTLSHSTIAPLWTSLQKNHPD